MKKGFGHYLSDREKVGGGSTRQFATLACESRTKGGGDNHQSRAGLYKKAHTLYTLLCRMSTRKSAGQEGAFLGLTSDILS